MIVGDSIEGRKMISVKKMKELLNDLLDTDYLCAQTIAETGNITIYHFHDDKLPWAGINVKEETMSIWDD